MWFPVDPVARESTLEFVAGSHLGPWYMPRTFLDGQAKWFPDGTLAELPTIDERPRSVPGDRLGARAGRRRVLPHAHAARRRRGRRGRPPAGAVGALPRRRHGARAATVDHVAAVPRLDDELAAGAPMDHPLFPVLWERDSDDGPRDRHGRPSGAARSGPREVDPADIATADDPGTDRRPHRHDAPRQRRRASPPTRSACRCASP